MSIALQCAARGRGAVEPNPMVGAVLAGSGKELARGWHKRFGGPHAEIDALEAARSSGADPRGATLYVTLEPCCHHAKTPPCTDAIISAGVRRVVVALKDPDQQVSGEGLAALRAAGVEVDLGVREAEARELLAAYVKLRTLGRPWVICKWAQTSCGHIALPPGQGKWISCQASRDEAQRTRRWCDGVLVGAGTVAADDPLLTCRVGERTRGKLTRIVLDSSLRIAMDCRLVATCGEAPVIVATTCGAARAKPCEAQSLRDLGVEVLELPASRRGVGLEPLLDELGRRQWTYLLVEGGAKVLRSVIFSRAGADGASLADELRVFVSPRTVDPGADLPRFDIEEVVGKLGLGRGQESCFGEDRMLRYVIRR